MRFGLKSVKIVKLVKAWGTSVFRGSEAFGLWGSGAFGLWGFRVRGVRGDLGFRPRGFTFIRGWAHDVMLRYGLQSSELSA